MATLGLAGYGYGINYEFGLFRQEFLAFVNPRGPSSLPRAWLHTLHQLRKGQ